MDHSEDTLALRRNPLNIRASDGSDIVLGKTPRHAKAVMHEHEHAALGALAAKADCAYADYGARDDDNDGASDDSVPTAELTDQLTDLDIGAAPAAAQHTVAPLSPTRLRMRASESMDLSAVDLDFGADISSDLGGLLSRKNTIALRKRADAAPNAAAPRASTGPSRDKQLIQRLRSIRKRLSSDSLPQVPDADVEDDARRAEGLPDNVLKMIAFSPDSPWLGSEISASDDDDNDDEIKPSRVTEAAAAPANTLAPAIEFPGSAHATPEPPIASASAGDSPEGAEPELNPFRTGSRAASPASNASTALTPESTVSEYAGAAPKQVRPATPLIEETDPVRPEDRGRLFLQVNKLANVRGLPIDPARHPRFTLVLDNGLQTVTTEPAPLPAAGFNGLLTAKVGQEFELVVAQDLELVVTVNVQMDALQPPARPAAPRIAKHAPTPSIASAGSGNSRGSSGAGTASPVKGVRALLRSPRKKQSERWRRQQEEREREEQRELEQLERQQQQDEVERKRYDRDIAEFHRRADTWRNITGPGGEYCRGYMFESHYERDIYGEAKSFALPLYNEWDTASNGVPKPVCDLQITMMYVPKLFGSEHIPMSMKECQQELRAAAEKRTVGLDGFLTQQGGDCTNIWRRRWFTLNEAEMVGHHEATRKRRALIHLENAVAVKDTLSDDLWCIYEDRSFEISFGDGEALSFYADSVAERDRWVAALRSSIANCTGRRRAWTDLVLARQAERQTRSDLT